MATGALLVVVVLGCGASSGGAKPSATASAVPAAGAASPTPLPFGVYHYPPHPLEPITKDVGTRTFPYHDVLVHGRNLIMTGVADGLAVVVTHAGGIDVVDLRHGAVHKVLDEPWTKQHAPSYWVRVQHSSEAKGFNRVVRGVWGAAVSRRWLVWKEGLMGIGNGGVPIACALYAAPLRSDWTIGRPLQIEQGATVNGFSPGMLWEFALSGDRLLWADAVRQAPYGRLRMRRLGSGVTSTLGQTRGVVYLSLQGSQLLVEVQSAYSGYVTRMLRYDLGRDAMPMQVIAVASRAIERDDCQPVLAPGGGIAWSGVPSGIPSATDITPLFELAAGRGIVCLAGEGYKPATVGRYVAYYVDDIGTTLRVDAVDPVTLERFRIAGADHAAWEELFMRSWSLSYGTTLVVPSERTADRRRVLRLRVFDLGG